MLVTITPSNPQTKGTAAAKVPPIDVPRRSFIARLTGPDGRRYWLSSAALRCRLARPEARSFVAPPQRPSASAPAPPVFARPRLHRYRAAHASSPAAAGRRRRLED